MEPKGFSLLKQLLEGPDFLDKEMPIYSTEHTFNFYSEDTVKDMFDILSIDKINNDTVVTIISKSKKFAVIGMMGNRREDDKTGIFIKGKVEFQFPPNISFTKEIETKENVLQVSSVEVNEENKRKGLGFLLYMNLAKAGYVVLSDNLQYLGGKALWKKISRFTKTTDYGVYILENGKPITDKAGDPKLYTGSNILDKRIWAPPSEVKKSKRYTLLLLRKKV